MGKGYVVSRYYKPSMSAQVEALLRLFKAPVCPGGPVDEDPSVSNDEATGKENNGSH